MATPTRLPALPPSTYSKQIHKQLYINAFIQINYCVNIYFFFTDNATPAPDGKAMRTPTHNERKRPLKKRGNKCSMLGYLIKYRCK